MLLRGFSPASFPKTFPDANYVLSDFSQVPGCPCEFGHLHQRSVRKDLAQLKNRFSAQLYSTEKISSQSFCNERGFSEKALCYCMREHLSIREDCRYDAPGKQKPASIVEDPTPTGQKGLRCSRHQLHGGLGEAMTIPEQM